MIKNEWENAWFCMLKDLQGDPKVNGTKITFSTPVRRPFIHTTGRSVAEELQYSSKFVCKLLAGGCEFLPQSSDIRRTYLSFQEQGKMFKKTGTKVVDLKSANIAEVNEITGEIP